MLEKVCFYACIYAYIHIYVYIGTRIYDDECKHSNRKKFQRMRENITLIHESIYSKYIKISINVYMHLQAREEEKNPAKKKKPLFLRLQEKALAESDNEVCVYKYMIYICTYIYKYMYICVYLHIFMYVYMYTLLNIFINICMYTRKSLSRI
jgi:hypothetical protein